MRIGALVVDDHGLFRKSIRSYLESLGTVAVAGEAADGVEAIEAAGRLRPQLVVMDVRMPRLDGIAASVRIRARDPQVRVILYSLADGELERARAAACADAVIAKDRLFEDLASAIARIGGETDAHVAAPGNHGAP